MENHHFLWENPLLMAIFNSYVKLPEGTWLWVKTLVAAPGSRDTQQQTWRETSRNFMGEISTSSSVLLLKEKTH